MSVRRVLAVAVTVALGSGTVVGHPVAAGPSGGALPPALRQVLEVAGAHGVPADAAMVAVNITATRAAGTGHFTAYACDGELPTASNVNYLADQNVPNLALVRIDESGSICIETSAVADVVVDVMGFVPAGSAITPLPRPDRAVDTRPARTLAAGGTLRVPVTSIAGVDRGADLVMANVTAIARGDTGYLTVHPCLDPVPGTSSVNFGPGQTNANFVTSRIAPSGDICITASEPADVIVDVAAAATDGITTLAAPIRLLDTRPTGRRPAGSTLALDIAGRPDVPDHATAAVYNLTAANAASVGYATSHPCLGTPPTASNLNYAPGPPRANGTITKLSSAGRLCITTSHQVDLIVDLIGYTTDTTHFVPLTPARIEDTRRGWQGTCDWVAPPFLRDGRFEAMNIRTGERRRVTAFAGENASGLVTRLGDQCGTFHVYLNSDAVTSRAPGLYRVGLDSSTERLLPALEAVWVVDVARTEYDGVVALAGDGSVWSLDTGTRLREPLEPMYNPDQDWYEEGTSVLSADGYTLARRAGRSLEIWDLVSGELTGVFEADRWITHVEIAPDGLYVTATLPHRSSDGRWLPDTNLVVTAFGDVVDEIPSRGETFDPFDLVATFIGDRTLAICTAGTGIFVRDLFGTATRTVSEAQLRGPPGVEVQVCPVDGSRGIHS